MLSIVVKAGTLYIIVSPTDGQFLYRWAALFSSKFA